MKTAIIDNGIDSETLKLYPGSMEHLTVSKGKVCSALPRQMITHGGLCARVFLETATVLPDISISLVRDNTGKSNIKDLVTALSWCAENDIKLISLSMGTIYPEDNQLIKDILEKIKAADIIIVAAANNQGRITIPAASDSCIGVCYEPLSLNKVSKSHFFYISNPFDGIDIITYPIDFPSYNITHSNSFSAAFLAGWIHRFADIKMTLKQVRHKLSDTFGQIYPTENSLLTWHKDYLREKMFFAEEHEAIIITCCKIASANRTIFIEKLRNIIINDGYTCAILREEKVHKPEEFRFSLHASPLSLTETLLYINKMCRPSVILSDIHSIMDISDVIVYSRGTSAPKSKTAELIYCLEEKDPDKIWIEISDKFRE